MLRLQRLEKNDMRETVPEFEVGDTVEVSVRIVEGAKTRNVDNVVVVRQGKVRRSKLYFLRQKVGKAARIKDKRLS
jgi:large subunit ribosomal protein L19